jgi:hypothetical protein
MKPPTSIIFGSQTIWPSAAYLAHARTILLKEYHLLPLRNAIKELPTLWQTLVDTHPGLDNVPGQQVLEKINKWIDQGELLAMPDPPINVLLTPLTVIIQMVQYFDFLNTNDYKVTHAQILKSVQTAGIQGCCIGLLSAIVLSTSESEEEIGRLAAIALRLAVCIGAFVDLDGVFADIPNESCSIVVRWDGNDGQHLVSEILKSYPEVGKS